MVVLLWSITSIELMQAGFTQQMARLLQLDRPQYALKYNSWLVEISNVATTLVHYCKRDWREEHSKAKRMLQSSGLLFHYDSTEWLILSCDGSLLWGGCSSVTPF